MSNCTIVIDTETTGLPPKGVPTQCLSKWDGCRIVQIAWQLHDSDGKLVAARSWIVNPSGDCVFSPGAVNIHGISKERAQAEGVDIRVVWQALMDDLRVTNKLVAHNMSFDDSVITTEIMRMGDMELLKEWGSKERHCTMLMGTERGKRWPKLMALYERTIGPIGEEVQSRLHDARTDVSLCADIYFRMCS